MDKLGTVFNRGFSTGFYLGQPGRKDFANTGGSVATTRKDYVGKVIHFDRKSKEAVIKLEAGGIAIGEMLTIQGKKTGVINQTIESIRISVDVVKSAKKSDIVSVKVSAIVEKGDKVFVIRRC
jgi:putative protease